MIIGGTNQPCIPASPYCLSAGPDGRPAYLAVLQIALPTPGAIHGLCRSRAVLSTMP